MLLCSFSASMDPAAATQAEFITQVGLIDANLPMLTECVRLCGDSPASLTALVVAQLKTNVDSLRLDCRSFETLFECEPSDESPSEDAWDLIKGDFVTSSDTLRVYRQEGLSKWNVTEVDIVNATAETLPATISLLDESQSRETFLTKVFQLDKTAIVVNECLGLCGAEYVPIPPCELNVLHKKLSNLNFGLPVFQTFAECAIDDEVASEDAYLLIKEEFSEFIQRLQDYRTSGCMTWDVSEIDISLHSNEMTHATLLCEVAALEVRISSVGPNNLEVFADATTMESTEPLTSEALNKELSVIREKIRRNEQSTLHKRRRLSRQGSDASSVANSPRSPATKRPLALDGGSPCAWPSPSPQSRQPVNGLPLMMLRPPFNGLPFMSSHPRPAAPLPSSSGPRPAPSLPSPSSTFTLSEVLDAKPLIATTSGKIMGSRLLPLKEVKMYEFELATEHARVNVVAWGEVAIYLDGQIPILLNKHVTLGPVRFNLYKGVPRLTLSGAHAHVTASTIQPSWLDSVCMEYTMFYSLLQKSDYAAVHIQAVVYEVGEVCSTKNASQRALVRLVDANATCIDLTLWGSLCDSTGWVRGAKVDVLYSTINKERGCLEGKEGTQFSFCGHLAEAAMPLRIQLLQWPEFRRFNTRPN